LKYNLISVIHCSGIVADDGRHSQYNHKTMNYASGFVDCIVLNLNLLCWEKAANLKKKTIRILTKNLNKQCNLHSSVAYVILIKILHMYVWNTYKRNDSILARNSLYQMTTWSNYGEFQHVPKISILPVNNMCIYLMLINIHKRLDNTKTHKQSQNVHCSRPKLALQCLQNVVPPGRK
jgi:hypothetical protein